MKFAIVLALAFLATTSAFSVESEKVPQLPPALPAFEVEGRITNGNNATLGQFPYVVRLRVHTVANFYFICTATLIGQQWLLTSAECVDGFGDIDVYLGAIDPNNAETVFTVPNSNSIVHPDWNNTYLHNDIALIQIPTVTYTDRTSAIQLPAYSAPLSNYANNSATIIGWGVTDDDSPVPTLAVNLQYANTTILSQFLCAEQEIVIDSMVCATTVTSSICTGDSGGPLVSGNTLVGLASYTIYGCSEGFPAGFTRVTSFLWWIKKNTGISY